MPVMPIGLNKFSSAESFRSVSSDARTHNRGGHAKALNIDLLFTEATLKMSCPFL
jgi:hypothetical protein